ncbi:Thyroid receptor-interacting protein 11 [Nymphon striatum]|nr:Thyroid receptor-interacting protein 11 [Nymphon striatum]
MPRLSNSRRTFATPIKKSSCCKIEARKNDPLELNELPSSEAIEKEGKTPVFLRVALLICHPSLYVSVERLRSLNAELEEKSQSGELQIAAISSEYRNLLDNKELNLPTFLSISVTIVENQDSPDLERSVRLINNSNLSKSLQPLSHRRCVADLSIFYSYLYGNCSQEIKDIIPGPMRRVRNTRQSSKDENKLQAAFKPSRENVRSTLSSDLFSSQSTAVDSFNQKGEQQQNSVSLGRAGVSKFRRYLALDLGRNGKQAKNSRHQMKLCSISLAFSDPPMFFPYPTNSELKMIFEYELHVVYLPELRHNPVLCFVLAVDCAELFTAYKQKVDDNDGGYTLLGVLDNYDWEILTRISSQNSSVFQCTVITGGLYCEAKRTEEIFIHHCINLTADNPLSQHTASACTSLPRSKKTVFIHELVIMNSRDWILGAMINYRSRRERNDSSALVYGFYLEQTSNQNEQKQDNFKQTYGINVFKDPRKSSGSPQISPSASFQNDLLKKVEHQDELTALQDFQEQKYSKLKEQYDEEVSKLQSNLSFYEKQTDSTNNEPNSTSLNEAFLASATEIENLKKELSEKETSDGNKARTIQLQSRQLNQTQSEKNILENELLKIKEEHESLIKSNSDLKAQIDSHNQQVKVFDSQTVSTETDETLNNLQEKEALIKSAQKKAESMQQDIEKWMNSHDVMEHQNNQLLIENEALLKEHHAFQLKIEDCKLEIKTLQTENGSILKNLEELDSQHESAIEQILSSKSALVEQNKVLQEKLQSYEAKYDEKQYSQEIILSNLFPLTLLEERLDSKLVEKIMCKSDEVTYESVIDVLSALNDENLALQNGRDSKLSENENRINHIAATEMRKDDVDLIQSTDFIDEVAEDKCREIDNLKEENKILETTLASVRSQIENISTVEQKKEDFVNTVKNSETEVNRLKIVEREKQEILSQFALLQSEYKSTCDTLNELESSNQQSSKLQDEIVELRIASSKYVEASDEVESLKSDLQVYLKQIQTLNIQYNESEKECKSLRMKLKEYIPSEILSSDCQKFDSFSKSIEDELTADDESCRIVSQVSDGSSGGSDFEIVGKDDGSDHSSSSKEFEKVVEEKESNDISEDISELILQKDNEIKELQEKILQMSQQLLDCQSPSADNSSRFEGSTLEEEVKNLKFEKEQILSVMNEKLKECSSLKGENHQLMNIISAEKQAMGKLLKDNEDLIKMQNECGDPELTKEAIQNLSRLVRDKDLEIEALCKKNNVLTEMYQTHSAAENENQIKSLLEEKEVLMKERNAYKSDREQILNALHQKHQESVNYHSELQKVQGLLSEVNKTYDNLEMKHKSMCEQYEGKQKTLLDVQNELIVLKQRLSFMEQEQFDLKSNYSSLLEKDKTDDDIVKIEKKQWSNKNEECYNLKKLVNDQEKMMSEKDLMIHSKSMKIKEFEEISTKKNDEIQLLNVNQSNANLQIKDLQEELTSARSQNATVDSSVDEIRSECNMMKEMTTKLTMTVKEKEFEVQSLNTKLSTLTKLLEEKSSADENLAKLLKDNETIRNQAQTLQHERDQAMLALYQCKQQIDVLQNQISVISDRESKLMKELERLRAHLVQVEESYTKEAIHAEEREKELRNRLAVADEKAHSSSNSFHTVNHQATLQVESLKEQLHSLADQRDNGLLQLSNSDSQIQQLNTSLNNLQLVLEQFQQEKFRDIEIVKKQMNNMIQEEKVKVTELTKEIDIKEARLKEAVEALSAASRLSEQLDKKEEAIHALKDEENSGKNHRQMAHNGSARQKWNHVLSKILFANIVILEMAFENGNNLIDVDCNSLRVSITSGTVIRKNDEHEKAMKQIQAFVSNNGGKVDKTIMKSLVLGYFSTPQDKRQEVVRLLASVLDFNQQEVQKVGLDHSKKNSWLAWLSRAEVTNEKHSTSSEKSSDNNVRNET